MLHAGVEDDRIVDFLCMSLEDPEEWVRRKADRALVLIDRRDACQPEPEWQHGESDGGIFLVIRDGVTADMLGDEGQISDEGIWHLVNYIRSLAERGR